MRVLLVIYDNNSYIHWFPQGSGYIAAALREAGCYVEIYNNDVHHYQAQHLTEYLDKNKFDVVGVGVIAGYWQYKKLLEISEAINNSKNRPFYILGAHGPSPEPEYFIKKTAADVIVIGEGEITVVELLDAFGNHKPLSPIRGIAYRNGDKVVINARRPLIEDVDSIPYPAYELFPMEYYRLMRSPHASVSDFLLPIVSGRGCKFTCNFCYRMDEGFRPRSNENIIEEIKFLKKEYGITYIVFSDELLMSSEIRTKSFCEDMIRAGLDIKWCCSGRLNYAKPDVLKLMKKSGCVFINYGIEALDDDILRNMNKSLTVSMITRGIESTLEAGISPGYNVIFGNIGENKTTLNKGVEFLLKYDDGSQLRTIRPVTPYPGSPLYYYAIKNGFLKDCEDFYENKHVNSDLLSVNFTDMSDDEFNKSLFEANSRLITNYFGNKSKAVIEEARKLYFEEDKCFRGFRQI